MNFLKVCIGYSPRFLISLIEIPYPISNKLETQMVDSQVLDSS